MTKLEEINKVRVLSLSAPQRDVEVMSADTLDSALALFVNHTDESMHFRLNGP